MNFPKAKANLRIRAVDDDLVIHDIDGQRVHIVNETASHVLELCDGKTSPQAIAETLSTRYSIDSDRALTDVRSILSTFYELGLASDD